MEHKVGDTVIVLPLGLTKPFEWLAYRKHVVTRIGDALEVSPSDPSDRAQLHMKTDYFDYALHPAAAIIIYEQDAL